MLEKVDPPDVWTFRNDYGSKDTPESSLPAAVLVLLM